MKFEQISKAFRKVQSKTIKQLEAFEKSQRFELTKWEHPENGGGLTCVYLMVKKLKKSGKTNELEISRNF